MGSRNYNHRLVKIHRTYTVEEMATLLVVHKNTVRQWLENGLATIDRRRPILVHGAALVAFLKQRRTSAKSPCQPGELYCLRCRAPTPPAGSIVDVYQRGYRLHERLIRPAMVTVATDPLPPEDA